MHPDDSGKRNDLLDRVLDGKDDQTKAKVLDLVLRLGVHPDDELFIVMIALNHLQVMIEDAPQDWQSLFVDFTHELDQWSKIHLETLNAIIRKSQQEETLATISASLVNALSNSTESWNALSKKLESSPLLSTNSKLMSSIHEVSTQLQSLHSSQKKTREGLTKLQNTNATSSAKKPVSLPFWLLLLLSALVISSFYNYTLLQTIHLTVMRLKS